MNNGLRLIRIAKELLQIEEDYPFRLKDPIKNRRDMVLKMFPQTWESTSLGFGGIGGSAMTEAMTYVLIPNNDSEDSLVYFAGCFAYKIPYSRSFINDVNNEQIESCSNYMKYLKKD